MFGLLDRIARFRASDEPLPDAWREILRRRVRFYARLRDEGRERFEEKLKVFARTKEFVGAGGMVIDEEVIVLVSAAAARLIMNLDDTHYTRLSEIVVYPSHYRHPGDTHAIVFGEANDRGTVVLSYDAVVAGIARPADGQDTALHEFAHALDAEDGVFDGTPLLDDVDREDTWSRVMTRAFGDLRGMGTIARADTFRAYGAKNEAEFFAVATEAFFEQPARLKAKDAELYATLVDYYALDPLVEFA